MVLFQKSSEIKPKVAKVNSSDTIEGKASAEFSFYSFKKYKVRIFIKIRKMYV